MSGQIEMDTTVNQPTIAVAIASHKALTWAGFGSICTIFLDMRLKVSIIYVIVSNKIVKGHTSNYNFWLLVHRIFGQLQENAPFYLQDSKWPLNHVSQTWMRMIEHLLQSHRSTRPCCHSETWYLCPLYGARYPFLLGYPKSTR